MLKNTIGVHWLLVVFWFVIVKKQFEVGDELIVQVS